MNRRAGIATIAIVAAALGAWGYSAYTAYSTRLEITGIVKDAARKLKPALEAQARADFDADARAVDAQVTRLRAMRMSSLFELADAADGYLVSAREILRRRSAMRRAQDALEPAMTALSRHLGADRGSAAWPEQAVALKQAVDRDLRELRIAAESYASLVGSLPKAQAKIAPHVNPGWLADERTIAAARAAALDALARTDENVKQTTRLDAYQGARRNR